MLGGSLHDPLRSPVVDPRCLGGGVDRCTVTPCSQHGDHSLDRLCCHTGCNQFRRKFCIDLSRLGLRRTLHSLCRIRLYRCRDPYRLELLRLCPRTVRCRRGDLGFCTVGRRLRERPHRCGLCIGRRGHGAGAACWFVPERNQHHGADGHCRVNDRGENPCRCRAVPDDSHQIAQRQEAHGECACADGCDCADRPAVNPAGRSGTDGEGDAVHGGEESDGRHSSGTDQLRRAGRAAVPGPLHARHTPTPPTPPDTWPSGRIRGCS
ncbi:MAG: hypothetical protein QOF66_7189 [Mycobacterium sp.]|nr:hypothetical protein [Mycobacterium sp.]